MREITRGALDACDGDWDRAELLMELCQDVADGFLSPGVYGSSGVWYRISPAGTFGPAWPEGD